MSRATHDTPLAVAMFVNGIDDELDDYTTTLLSRELTHRGATVWYVGVGGFAFDPDDRLRARARRVPEGDYADGADYLAALRGDDALEERIDVADLDVLLLRNDPSDLAGDHPWMQDVGIIFGQIAARYGVLVLNDPAGLAKARNKLYFQGFPREVRPRSLITLEADRIKEFIEEVGGRAVLKPLQGSGGRNVFIVEEGSTNVNQIIEAVSRDGYVIAQEYLPAAAEGDTRLFLLNGRPLKVEDRYAAMRRLTPEGESRSNISVGGEVVQAEIGEVELALAEAVRPKLVQDGMFLVGLDIAGDRLMEINVFSPGGLCSVERLEGHSFAAAVVDDLERKVRLRRLYGDHLANRELAVV